MKKALLVSTALAVVLPLSASAEDMDVLQVYGTVHSSADRMNIDDQVSYGINSSSRRGWALGAKGGADASGGLQAIYQFEVGYDGSKDVGTGAKDTDNDGKADTIADSSPGHFYLRDSWVGLKGAFGKVRIGTMATYYKRTGKDVDPLFTTALEGRDSTFNMMSQLHAKNGIGHGRSSDTFSYDSPLIAGMIRVNAHIQPRDGDQFNYGGGGQVRVGPATVFAAVTTNADGDMAMKGGAKVVYGPVTVAGQYERGDALAGKQHLFGSGVFKVTKEFDVVATASYEMDASDLTGTGAVKYRFSKKTESYLGYGLNFPGSSSSTPKYSVMTAGLKHKF